MKIQQEELEYRPITITLAYKSEAEAFFGIIDKVESWRCHEDEKPNFTQDEIVMMVGLSNWRSEHSW